MDPRVAPAGQVAIFLKLPDPVAEWILVSLLRARSTDVALKLSETDLLELPDGVLEIHVHAMFSNETHVLGVVRGTAGVS